MWQSARTWGYVFQDCLEGVVLPRRHQPDTFYLLPEQIRKILRVVGEPDRTIYWLVAETAIRRGEVLALRVEDVNLDAGTVQIRQSVWQGRIQSVKSRAANRMFALSPQLTTHLAAYLQTHWRPNPHGLLFTSRRGTAYDPSNFARDRLYPVLDSLGLPHCGFHAFRHGNSTVMDQQGIPLRVRQERLGHSDPRLTLNTYTHGISADHRQAAEKLGSVFDPSCPKFSSLPM
jgi:integrase